MPQAPFATATVDGVPCFWADAEGPFTATLMFGVGLREETAITAGTARLVQHLVMQLVGTVQVDHGSFTGDKCLAFSASGSQSAVFDFLARVITAVSSLHEITDEDVRLQKHVIAEKLGPADELPGRGPFLDRFGATSLGLNDVGSPAHRSISL